jgi:hypothetical protein
MNKRSAKIRLNVLIIVLTLLAVSLACETGSTGNGLNVETQVALTLAAMNPEPAETEAPASCMTVEFNGITLCYDPSLAQGVSTSVIDELATPDDPWFSMPQFERIHFDGYITGDKFHNPNIEVYSVEKYMGVNENATNTITKLQEYIANKPNIPDGPIPFLPAWNAAQLFRVIPAFVEFQNGQGIRFLAEYGQYSAPVNNTDLFYTFQGITDDGLYYVSVILPVTHPSLPPDANVDPALQQQLYDDYQGYLANIIPTLSAQPLGSFTPDLSLLDAMIQSMKIH